MSTVMMAMQRVRIRIRSWKDIVLIIVVGLIYAGISEFLKRKLFWDEKKASSVAAVIAFVIAIIGVFAVGD